jgi:hypothetical protein
MTTTPNAPLPQLLGFGGLLESGKDAIADYLVSKHDFVKVNMSDPIDRCLYAVDPIVRIGIYEHGYFGNLWRAVLGRKREVAVVRYRELRDTLGFTEAKKIPEVRALLQRIGKEMGRDIIDVNIWTNIARRTVEEHRAAGTPVVISGIRFVEEQDMVKDLGGTLVWVNRPGHVSTASATTGGHSTEVKFDGFDQDIIVENDGTLADLDVKAAGLVR